MEKAITKENWHLAVPLIRTLSISIWTQNLIETLHSLQKLGSVSLFHNSILNFAPTIEKYYLAFPWTRFCQYSWLQKKFQQIIQHNFNIISNLWSVSLTTDGWTNADQLGNYSAKFGSWPSHFAKNEINCTKGFELLLIFWPIQKATFA